MSTRSLLEIGRRVRTRTRGYPEARKVRTVERGLVGWKWLVVRVEGGWGEIEGFLEVFYSLGCRGFSRLRLRESMETNGIGR